LKYINKRTNREFAETPCYLSQTNNTTQNYIEENKGERSEVLSSFSVHCALFPSLYL